MSRVHYLPTGTMQESKKEKCIPLYTSMRYALGRQSSRAPMASLVDYFSTYGVNSSPLRSGVTGGERHIVSARNVSKYTYVKRPI